MASGAVRRRIPALLFAAAIAASLLVVWRHAIPVFDSEALSGHRGHASLLVVHVTGGVSMLALGAANVFIGTTRRGFAYHRLVGYSYLTLGSMGAVTALSLSILAPHEPKSLYVATGTLAIVWLAVAAMAWRAARNRRFDMHREWMIRSYVLSLSFVGCRLATRFSLFGALGREGATASFWVYWIVPFVICEIALQWRRGGPLERAG